MYKNLLVTSLLVISTTALLAEESGPNQTFQVKNSKVIGQSEVVPNKRISIRVSPFSILAGIAQLSLNYAVTDKFSLGFEGSHLMSAATLKSRIKELKSDASVDNYEISALSYGVRADYALGDSVMANTWYLSGGLSNVIVGAKSRIDVVEASGDVTFGRALVGFQWVKEHFLINLAGGISTVLSEKYKVNRYYGWASENPAKNIGSGPALEFSLGYVF